jgi:hypothetical protein
LKEQLTDKEESIGNKEKLINQLTNEIQASKQDNQPQDKTENEMKELTKENEALRVSKIYYVGIEVRIDQHYLHIGRGNYNGVSPDKIAKPKSHVAAGIRSRPGQRA